MFRFHRGTSFWGFMLIIVGGLFLLNSMDIVRINIWDLFFPAMLIFGGFWLLTWRYNSSRLAVRKNRNLSVPLDGAERASINIQNRSGHLVLENAAPQDQLIKGYIGESLDYNLHQENGQIDLDLKVRGNSWHQMYSPWHWHERHSHTARTRNSSSRDWCGSDFWDMESGYFTPWRWNESNSRNGVFSLSGEIPLTLSIEAENCITDLDLSGMQVTDFNLQAKASESEVTLPVISGITRVRIHNNDSKTRIYLPEDVAAIISSSDSWENIYVDLERFIKNGDLYQSQAYETSKYKVEIVAESIKGTLEIK